MNTADAKPEQDFEQRLKRLREIVEQLEGGELPLEQGVALYKEGVSLAKAGRRQLQNARNEIQIYSDGLFKEFAVNDEEQENGAGQGALGQGLVDDAAQADKGSDDV